MANICPICRNIIVGEICGYHTRHSVESGWARTNKIWNDFLMRGVPLPNRVEKGLEKLP